ncbi:MAG: phosphatase domain-containing protein [Myxococcota bacterium]
MSDSADERLADLERTSDRVVPPSYQGDVLLFDIDKTYLDTHFSSWRGLLAIPLEFAIDKEAVPGATSLIRALRRGPEKKSALVPLYFVSGSPRELRRVIERKMTLDGVEFDGITFKDQLGLAKKGRFSAIKAQVGYKLRALILYALELPPAARWLCFGDDVEADAEVFQLFGAVVAGLRGAALEARLVEAKVEAVDRARVLPLADALGDGRPNPIERIFIHRTSDRQDPHQGGAGVVATRTFLGAAWVLRAMGKLNDEQVVRVAEELRTRRVDEALIAADAAEVASRYGVEPHLLKLGR